MTPLKLYTSFRNQAGYRVRIALGLKGLSYEYMPIHLRKQGGENHSIEYRALNRQALLPTLAVDGSHIPQSLAILEYLEEVAPEPPLLPEDPVRRGRVRAFANFIACEVTPLNNLRVHRWMRRDLELDDDVRQRWFDHWIEQGLTTLEQSLAEDRREGPFCFGRQPSFADCCLVPLLDNASRNGIDLAPYPLQQAVMASCGALPAFADAAPARQPDAE